MASLELVPWWESWSSLDSPRQGDTRTRSLGLLVPLKESSMPATPSLVDIQPLVRMVLAQLTGWDANLAVPALHAALCEITRAQFSGDATVSALTIIENTLAYYREHQQPLSGLSISETPRPQDVQ